MANTLPSRRAGLALSRALRPTRAEVDLGAIAHNLRVVRAAAGGAGVLAVVKADAYGHGVVPVAARLAREPGVVGLGVALAEEGLELRDAGVRTDILVLNGVYGRHHRDVLEAGLTPVVYDRGHLRDFHAAARGLAFGVHLHLDTGMARLGVTPEELDGMLDALAATPGARLDGVMTHLAAADGDPELTATQLRRFGEMLWRIRARGHRPATIHAANSAATFRHPEARFDWVRPGIALFGVSPAAGVGEGLRPAMRLRTEIVALRDVPTGAPVGYDATWRAPRPSRIATVPLGYGDGLFWGLGNRGELLVRGRRCRIVGRVSMDLTTLDVTDLGDVVALGDEVVVLGASPIPGAPRLGAADVAAACGTIPYEVLTSISRRVPRVYRDGV